MDYVLDYRALEIGRERDVEGEVDRRIWASGNRSWTMLSWTHRLRVLRRWDNVHVHLLLLLLLLLLIRPRHSKPRAHPLRPMPHVGEFIHGEGEVGGAGGERVVVVAVVCSYLVDL